MERMKSLTPRPVWKTVAGMNGEHVHMSWYMPVDAILIPADDGKYNMHVWSRYVEQFDTLPVDVDLDDAKAIAELIVACQWER